MEWPVGPGKLSYGLFSSCLTTYRKKKCTTKSPANSKFDDISTAAVAAVNNGRGAFPFFRLPPELRNEIYEMVMLAQSISFVSYSWKITVNKRTIFPLSFKYPDPKFQLLEVCRQMHDEAAGMFFSISTFSFGFKNDLRHSLASCDPVKLFKHNDNTDIAKVWLTGPLSPFRHLITSINIDNVGKLGTTSCLPFCANLTKLHLDIESALYEHAWAGGSRKIPIHEQGGIRNLLVIRGIRHLTITNTEDIRVKHPHLITTKEAVDALLMRELCKPRRLLQPRRLRR